MTGLIGILFQNPFLFAVIALSLVLSVTIHEFAHAYAANKLGDPTAKNLGRLNLNPLSHLDPLGTLSLLFFGFGWGKAVPVNYFNLKNPKRDAAIISFAGPGSNFALALLATLILKILEQLFSPLPYTPLNGVWLLIRTIFYPIILYNIVLGIFNLLPFEPLDGFKIVNGILPPKLSLQWSQTAPFGLFILIFLATTGGISRIISPIVSQIIKLLGL